MRILLRSFPSIAEMSSCGVECADACVSLRGIPSYYCRCYSHAGTVVGANAKKIELFRDFAPDLQKGNLPSLILTYYVKIIVYINASFEVYTEGLASFRDYASLSFVLVSCGLFFQARCPICRKWRYHFDFVRQGLGYARVGIVEDDRISELECRVNSESLVVPATEQSLLPVEPRDDVTLVLKGARVIGEDDKPFAWRVYRQVICQICRGSSVGLTKSKSGKAKVLETPFVHALRMKSFLACQIPTSSLISIQLQKVQATQNR